MIKTISITENKIFKRLYYRGKSMVSPIIVLYYMPGIKGENRLGITVSTKIGHAVVRNRIKRQLKEAYRLLEPSFIADTDLVFVARKAIIGCSFNKIYTQMSKISKKAGLLQ